MSRRLMTMVSHNVTRRSATIADIYAQFGQIFKPTYIGKRFLFVICMISRHRFQTMQNKSTEGCSNYFHLLTNFLDFGATISFFRYIINQNRKMCIKNYSPVFQNTAYIRYVYQYNK